MQVQGIASIPGYALATSTYHPGNAVDTPLPFEDKKVVLSLLLLWLTTTSSSTCSCFCSGMVAQYLSAATVLVAATPLLPLFSFSMNRISWGSFQLLIIERYLRSRQQLHI
ncbi:hypothetical protein ACJW30_04G130400 [Castanea mollissima]